MSNRLNQERQMKLEPIRMKSCKNCLMELGYDVTDYAGHKLTFIHNGNTVVLFPYSGWFSGKGIGSGRGFRNLLNKLKEGADDLPDTKEYA